MLLLIAATLICVALLALNSFYVRRFGYWSSRGVAQRTASVPWGNFENPLLMKSPACAQIWRLYNYFKEIGAKHGGLYVFSQVVWQPVDPELIRSVLSKDADHFLHKPFYTNSVDQPLSENLFFSSGDRWRLMRQKLTPTFTTGKMKMMLATVVECGQPVYGFLEESARCNEPVDIKEVAAKFTTDVIGAVAFGIKCNSFADPDAEFRKHGKEIFRVSLKKAVEGIAMFAFQDFARKIGLVPFPKDVERFLSKVIRENIAYREKHGTVKNDFMQLMMNLKNSGSVDGSSDRAGSKISMDDVIAQSFIFFIAGFETSSTTMTFCMLELAQHQEVQDKVREEVRRVLEKHEGQITYEALAEMSYTKQVIDETLRKYPALPTIDRKCNARYNIPDTDIYIEKDTPVVISTLGLQRDPEHFPDPENFDPERFSPENVGNIKPFTYLPFGEGPRQCLGLRFGYMQMKVGLIVLLKDYKYSLNKNTNPNIELDLTFTLSAKGVIYLDVEKAE